MPLPSIDDMLAAGLSLPEAFAFWAEMMSRPDSPPSHWWGELRTISSQSSLVQ